MQCTCRSFSAIILLVPYVACILGSSVEAQAFIIDEIDWSSSNPMFEKDDTDYVLFARLKDQLNIVCPPLQYSVIYRVNRTQYMHCSTYGLAGTQKEVAASCLQPNKTFIMTFREYSPLPRGLEYKPYEDYYFISTSTGVRAQHFNMEGGLCKDYNMKFRVSLLPRNTLLEDLKQMDDQKYGRLKEEYYEVISAQHAQNSASTFNIGLSLLCVLLSIILSLHT